MSEKVLTNKVKIKSRYYTVIIEKDEDGYYIATVPAFKVCYTQAKTRKELDKNIKEVIELWLESEEKDEVTSEPELEYIDTVQYEVASE